MNLILEKQALPELLQSWRESFDVFLPQKLERFSHFMPLQDDTAVLVNEPHNTRIPPKALFLPMTETLVKFTRVGGYKDAENEVQPRVVFAIRPCDAQAVQLLDTSFLEEDYSDPLWREKREKTVTVGLGCHEPCLTGFCTTVGGGPFNKAGLDVLLTDIGGSYLVEVLTDKGTWLFTTLQPADDSAIETAHKIQQEAFDRMEVAFKTEHLKEKLEQNFDSAYWDSVSQSCLGCGVCTFLCPTCFCFDIVDETQRRERVRNWDSCMFRTYSLEASGHNPRPSRVERTRQRLSHKFVYWIDQVNQIGCTGCGRCVRYCPVGLDIRAMLRQAQTLPFEVSHAA
ncbi:MAG: 4Fe-4S dicluster domain-containing protein [Anaerolineaceae bacterium]|nr:4Fe-4S dicluster domain-containing protein [Anaerolineaceae bacterium]